jgi:RHS repeat-associated protein
LGELTRGRKFFELSNHLGNVLVTVSDRKLQMSSGGATVDYYTADVVSATDYYPFGMQMPGRKFSIANTNYRYGFNGKENDPETVGTGQGTQDYGERIYNPSLGRFLSVDPITSKYPELTPYQFASNRPIEGKDLDGLEFCRYDLDSYDPNVKQMAKWDGVTNYRDSKNYQIFNETRNSITMPFVEAFAAEGAGALLFKGLGAAWTSFKAYRAATYLTRAAEVAIKSTEKVWAMVPVKRGFAIEKLLGGNLPAAFPTIDKFIRSSGIAESIKSIDLGAKTYQNMSKLKSTLTGYVDNLAAFKGAEFSGEKIAENEIKEKVLTVAFDPSKASSAQSAVFSEMETYAKDKGVKLVAKAVE